MGYVYTTNPPAKGIATMTLHENREAWLIAASEKMLPWMTQSPTLAATSMSRITGAIRLSTSLTQVPS